MPKVFAATSLLAGAYAQSVSWCGSPGDHMQNVVVKMSPDPPVKGEPLTMTFSGMLDEDVGAGSIDVDLDAKFLSIIDKTIKKSAPFSLTPAYQKGDQSVIVGPFVIQNFPGSASVKGTVKLFNEKNEPVTCVNMNFDLGAPKATEPVSKDIVGGANCGKPTDHLQNIQASYTGGVVSVAGKLDEPITKSTLHVDLKIHEIFSIPFKMDIPITMSPGIPAGDFKLTAGPPKPGDVDAQRPLYSVTGTVTVDDGNNEEICCYQLPDGGKVHDVKIPVENATDSTCAKPGDCGLAYQACCAGFEAKGYPCGCHLKDGTGKSGPDCGTCGTAYSICCAGFAAKGFPCTCDISSDGIVV